MAAFATIATLGLNILSAQQQVRAQEKQTQAQLSAADAATSAQISELQRSGEIEGQRRQDLLDKDLARRRARFAGRGLAPSDGSAAAVLSGLAEESRLAGEEDAFFRGERIRELERTRLEKGRLDLLQATDIRARQRLRTFQGGLRAGTSLFNR